MFRKNIGIKLTIGVVIIVLVVIGVHAWLDIRSQSRSLLSEVERHASQLSEAVKSDTEHDMLRNDRKRIHESIRRIGQQDSIDRVRVFNKAGEIIYSSEEADIGKLLDQQAESCYQCHSAGEPLEHLDMQDRTRIFQPHPDSPRLLGIINPIYNAPSCWSAECHAHPQAQTVLGVLDVTIPLTEVDRNIRKSAMAAVIMGISTALVLSLVVWLMVRRWIDRPVQELVTATRNVAGGNLAYRLDVKRDDEIGTLADSFNDMTEKLAQARLQLFQSDKLASLGRLAAGVAHEINNPLTAVLTYSSFLLKRSEKNPEVHEDLQVIVAETIRCREIVRNLLDFSRQTVPRKRQADANDIISRAAKVVENQLALGRVELVMDLDPDLPGITVDANQIQQVFINLIVNAADAIGDKEGTITVSSRAINLKPAGVLQIKNAVCRKRHELVDRKYKIDGKPAITMRFLHRDQTALIHLDPMYGSNDHQLDDMPDMAEGVELVCPECETSLVAEDDRCPQCGDPIYVFEVPLKGLVQGCLRPGCSWHHWEQVDASWNEKFVEVRVEDDGCGIPRSQIPHLFEPFATTKGPKGTGLGLAVTWGIVDNHNGTISVESEVDVGTTFIVRIPVQS
ncbi:MAG: HAMP domain-containing protein [Gammaproteobacteria bacterium]|nr:HAMP domain-containing protein [Gammaproteobacteria bacterium]NNK33756.1 HAMP domain-containing protein [Xanthomonadales bacterium]